MRFRGSNILVERLTNMYIIDHRLILYYYYDPEQKPGNDHFMAPCGPILLLYGFEICFNAYLTQTRIYYISIFSMQ